MAKTNAERQRDFRARNALSQRDPLLEALIAKLPEPGSVWGEQGRGAWLDLVEKAFDLIYTQPERTVTQELAPGAVALVKPTLPTAAHAGYDYFIDLEGFARRDPGGDRIMADDIPEGEIVYDERPVRDRATITWADGAQGSPPGMNFCGPGTPPGLD